MSAPAGRRGRGRPRIVTTEAVLGAARELGLDNLSIAAVADRLGVARVSVHRLVGSRDDLETLLGEAIITGSPPVLDEGEPLDQYLLKVARSIRDLIRAHPGLATYYARGFPRSERSAARMESSIRALTGRGLPPGPAARLVSSVASFAIANTRYHLAHDAYWSQGPPAEVVGLDPAEFPSVVAAQASDVWDDWPDWSLRAAVRGMIDETYATL